MGGGGVAVYSIEILGDDLRNATAEESWCFVLMFSNGSSKLAKLELFSFNHWNRLAIKARFLS